MKPKNPTNVQTIIFNKTDFGIQKLKMVENGWLAVVNKVVKYVVGSSRPQWRQ